MEKHFCSKQGDIVMKPAIYLKATYSQVIDVTMEQVGEFKLWYTSPEVDVYVDRSQLHSITKLQRDNIRHAAMIAVQSYGMRVAMLKDARKVSASKRTSKSLKDAHSATTPMFPKDDEIPF